MTDDDDDLDQLSAELDSESDDAEEETAATKRVLTPSEWTELKTLWELGKMTLSQLSSKFGIRKDSIHKRLKKEGIVRGSRAAQIETAVVDEAMEDAARTTKRIRETKETHYTYAEALARLVMNTVIKSQQAAQKFAMIDGDLAALGKAAKTLEIIRKERYALLGLDKEDGDPSEIDELLISTLTDEQIEAYRAAMRQGDPGLELPNLDDLDVIETGDEDA